MYEDWYSAQYHQYNDSFNSEWEIFGIRAQPSSELLGPLERLSAQAVFGWLESGAREKAQSNDRDGLRIEFHLM
jgi:hypothetical protein